MATTPQPNSTNTNFVNGLESSKFLNIPNLAIPDIAGLKQGALNYFTSVSKLATWNGTTWVYLQSEANADGKFVPLTRNFTINGVTHDLSVDRTFTIPTVTVDAVPTFGSLNAVQSGGTYNALQTKANLNGGNTFNGFQSVNGGISAIDINASNTLSISKFGLIQASLNLFSNASFVKGGLFVNRANGAGVHQGGVTILPQDDLVGNVTLFTPRLSGTIARLEDIPVITIDANPTSGSSNAVSSGGVFTALQGKQNNLSLTTTGTNGTATFVGSVLNIPVVDLSGYQLLSQKGVANGYASLGIDGRVPAAQLPVGAQVYKGTWNASTNTPTLADGTGTAGWTYRVVVGGTQNLGSGSITFVAGDDVIYNGTVWQRNPASMAVSSVNGMTGAVVLNLSIYELLSNKQSDLTPSTTKYPTANAVNTGLGLKANLNGGNTFTGGDQLIPSDSIKANGVYFNYNSLDYIGLTTIVTRGGGYLQESGGIQIYSRLITDRTIFKKATIASSCDQTSDIGLFLPTLSGTLARIEDIPNLSGYAVLANNNTFTAQNTFTGGMITNQFSYRGVSNAREYINMTTVVSSSTYVSGKLNLITDRVDGTGSRYTTDITQSVTIGSNVSLRLPNSSGTLALLTDIPSLAGYELLSNKQNSLATDVTNTKYPTVSSVNLRAPFVTPEEYGAVGNGTTDDKTALQNAINTGLPVRLARKKYYISGSITIPGGTNITGAGAGGASNIYINSNNPIFIIAGHDIIIDKVSFTGSDLTPSSTPTYPNQNGISVLGSSSLLNDWHRIVINNCSFYGLNGAGIYIGYNGTWTEFDGVQIANSYAKKCTYGFFCDVRGEYNTFTGCKSYACYMGFRDAGGNNIFSSGLLSGNSIGAYLTGGENNAHSIIGNTLINHNSIYGVQTSGVTLGWNLTSCEIYSNDIYIDTSIGIKFTVCDISVPNIYFKNSSSIELIDIKFTTTPNIYLSWNGTDNTGTPSDVVFFNPKFWASLPGGIIYNQLINGLTISSGSLSLPSGNISMNGGISMNGNTGTTIQMMANGSSAVLMSPTYNIIGSGNVADFNTYIYGNNPYAIWTNGVKRFHVDGGGNVGIGTNSPQQSFVVSSNGGTGIEFAINQLSGLNIIQSYDRSASVYKDLELVGSNVNVPTPVNSKNATTKAYVDGKTESGVYTPTVTISSGASTATANTHHYSRVENQVTVTGSQNITTSSAITVDLLITLPIASSFTSTYDLVGSGTMNVPFNTISGNLRVVGNLGSPRKADILFQGANGSFTIFYTFMYTVV